MKNEDRRSFLKNAMLLTGGMGTMDKLVGPILKAASINPAPNSTFLDAEHVVVLMQENRSFDHMFGSLQGVRGFNDPRAIRLKNNNPVFLQSDRKGDTYGPFHLDLNNSKATWMRDLPHSWPDQTDARNNGFYDKWLEAKVSRVGEYKDIPLTMGYYDRKDLPFYYSLADAFTVCDQYFCSTLSSTTPNRIHLWSGTLRDRNDASYLARVWNSDAKPWNLVDWKTFPERMEDHHINWKVYQNELYKKGLPREKESLLDNFGDNTLENFAQFNVDCYRNENYELLTPREKSLHNKAFTTNVNDENYHEIEAFTYQKDGETLKEMLPKGDLLYQFRQDVKNGELPTVSWLVPPGKFSDHPGYPWYGAWYISEIFKILTENPEVWKKTIFILNYDENDGYFDHIPPFVPPHPNQAESGKLSKGLDGRSEYVLHANEQTSEEKDVRLGPIGLGYRVPMIVASPWSKGGWVNSQIFDHTSTLMFLENFLSHKTGQNIKESNISSWRRNVCGDITSVFRKQDNRLDKNFEFLDREHHVERIHQSKFKKVPDNYQRLSENDIEMQRQEEDRLVFASMQEKGIRPSCALPYQFEVNGELQNDESFELSFENNKDLFGESTVGVALAVYTIGQYRGSYVPPRNYAITPGDTLKDTWDLDVFDAGNYHLKAYGPNGFYREFAGSKASPKLKIHVCSPLSSQKFRKKPKLQINIQNFDKMQDHKVTILHHHYERSKMREDYSLSDKELLLDIDLHKSHGWYDFSIVIDDNENTIYRYAGHVETGKSSYTDPLMGQLYS